MMGVHSEDNQVATGFGIHLARPILREEWKEDLSFEEGVQLLEKCMCNLVYRGRSAVKKLQVSQSSNSLFLYANMYYDIAQRMSAHGLMVEALSYAKDAYRLHCRLFQTNFSYSEKDIRMHPQVATAAWSSVKVSSDFEGCILTPWNVLRCYLESIPQTGTIHEIVGNVSEAESLLLWGKKISSIQGLPIF